MTTPTTAENIRERLFGRCTTDPETGCIEFTGYRDPSGYGSIKYEGRMQQAHRVAWQLEHGPIPKGEKVLHLCNNPPCCLVSHLETGDQARNMQYAVECGRSPRGERHHLTVLRDDEVREIYALAWATNPPNMEEIGRLYGVDISTVSYIKSRRRRAHLTADWNADTQAHFEALGRAKLLACRRQQLPTINRRGL